MTGAQYVCYDGCHNSLPKSWLTNAVKSTQCYLCCLPLVVLSFSFTRLTVFLLNIKHRILSLDHHWLGWNDFCNCFVSPSLHTHVTDDVWLSMAACQNQAWRVISNWDGCVVFLPLLIFVGECRVMQTEKLQCLVVAGCICPIMNLDRAWSAVMMSHL